MGTLGWILVLAAVTYPTRAIPLLVPGMNRLPPAAREYLQILAPATLAALAATAAFAPDGRFGLGPESLAVAIGVALTAWRHNLLIGVGVAALTVAIARHLGL